MKYTVIERFEFAPGDWMNPGDRGDMLPHLCRRYVNAGYLTSPDYEPPTKEKPIQESPEEGAGDQEKATVTKIKEKSK